MTTELIKAAKIAFASEYSFYLKAQNFHWNVTGINFPQYHQLFGTIYEEVGDSIDPFAENIRKLGSFTPASFDRFSMLTAINDELEVLPSQAMIAELLEDSDKMCKVFKMVYDLSEAAGEIGLSNFLAERMDAHRKHSWMLRSTLG
ncbi:DNA starvation/stationary phase protection protein [bacterium]|jgi:starvation-inducible DNA-binding protein|nr:DNA starvation/stationary phase protection protein [bacterium]